MKPYIFGMIFLITMEKILVVTNNERDNVRGSVSKFPQSITLVALKNQMK